MLRPRFGLLLTLICAVSAYGCNRTPKPATTTDTSGQGASAASTHAADTLAFHAVGTEPFWSLDIAPSGLRFTTPEDTSGILAPATAADAVGDTLHWAVSTQRAKLDVRLWPGSCSDGMSDRVWKYHAAVRVDTAAYRGCAESRPH